MVDHSTPPKNFWPPFLSRPSLGRPESKAKRARLFSSSPPAAYLLEQMNRRGSAPPTIYVYRDRLKSCTTKATKGRKFSHSGKSLFAKPTYKHIFSQCHTFLGNFLVQQPFNMALLVLTMFLNRYFNFVIYQGFCFGGLKGVAWAPTTGD